MAKTTGLGHLFKRGKVWQLAWTVNGVKRAKSLNTTNKEDAITEQKRMMGLQHQIQTTEDVIHHTAKNKKLITLNTIKLDKVWDEYDKNFYRPTSSPGTLGNHERNWKQLKNWLNEKHPEIKTLNEITKEIAVEYSNYLWQGGIHGDTFKLKLTSIKMIYRTLMEEKKTPFDGIKKETGNNIGREGFTDAQMAKIHELLNDPDFELEDKDEWKVVCKIGQYFGFRFVDAVLLKCKSINFDLDNVTIVPVKTQRTGVTVTIPMALEIRNIFQGLDLSGEYVSPNLAKRYLSPKNKLVGQDFAVILKKAKIREIEKRNRGLARNKFGFYSYRHQFAVKLANSVPPTSLPTLSSMLGDNPATAAKYYIKISGASKITAINALFNNKPESTEVSDAERIANAVKMIETVTIDGAIKAELLKILQG